MSRCSTCGAEIDWCVTEKGKAMPVNPEPSSSGNLVRSHTDGDGRVVVSVIGGTQAAAMREHGVNTYLSHFVDCPQSAQHRKR